jgi:hypothetical protein
VLHTAALTGCWSPAARHGARCPAPPPTWRYQDDQILRLPEMRPQIQVETPVSGTVHNPANYVWFGCCSTAVPCLTSDTKSPAFSSSCSMASTYLSLQNIHSSGLLEQYSRKLPALTHTFAACAIACTIRRWALLLKEAQSGCTP